MGNNSLLEQGGLPRGYVFFSANPADTGSLYIHTPQPPVGGVPGQDPQVIANFATGDNIYIEELEGGPLTATYTPGNDVTGTLLISDAGAPIYKFNYFRGDAALNYQAAETLITDPLTGATVSAIDLFVCFARGTRIATPDGERRVESLRVGDQVLAVEDGHTSGKRVRWMGQRRVNLAAHPRPELAAPIRFRAGALGDGLPARDLIVSPDHALLINERLVRAKLLINGMTIVQERDLSAVTYYHVELENHGILLAERVPAESYLDTGNRGFFANSDLPLVLHPDLMAAREAATSCAPLVRSAAEAEPIWNALADRARQSGFAAPRLNVAADPDLRLVVNGTTVRPHAQADGRYQFVVPLGARSLRLLSRHFLPADIRPTTDDWRRLGVAVASMVLRTGSEMREIVIDDRALARGWHAVERGDGALWRWTDGDAALPTDCLDGGTLEVRVRATGLYPIGAAIPARRAA
ncbi:MAG: Hint domain-containing protein [Acetobacteraceae bacterium]